MRFGRWLVIHESDRILNKKGQTRITYFCRCDCGTERVLPAVNFVKGHSQSCGCQREERRLKALRKPVNHVAANIQFRSYRQNAKDRGYDWELTQEDVSGIIFSVCQYCGSAPSVTKRNSIGNTIPSMVNGIDRVDNNIGYKIGNVVPCCWTCNKAKGSSSHEEFRNWINQIIKHHTPPS